MSSVKTAEYDEEKNRVEGGTLYLVATPIGNLSDLSPRAMKVLSEADFIAAEDTRNTAKLLAAFDIHRPMVSYFEHNKRERGEIIAGRLAAGESCALVTDAGTPAISDPGEDLVALCAERGIPVTSVPGPVASVTALTLSGLPNERRTMLFHEAPHKLRATLTDLTAAFGPERRVAICRELTKRNEEILRLTLGEAEAYYAETDPRGEYVLVVEGASRQQAGAETFWTEWDIPTHVAFYTAQGMSKMDAIKKAAKDRGVPKNTVYRQML